MDSRHPRVPERSEASKNISALERSLITLYLFTQGEETEQQNKQTGK